MKKKLTDVAIVTAETRDKRIQGILASDRVGEVKFISVDKLVADGVKAMPDLNGAE